MKKCLQSLVLVALLAAGCSTVPDKYKPAQVGFLDSENIADGIEFTIKPATDGLVMGELLFFDISLKNVGASGFWFPRQPDVLLTWIYSSGQRDNLLFESEEQHFYTRADAVFVKPGQTMKTRMSIKTYYFPRIGITEFQAFYSAPENTNPELKPFWNGRIYSNAYGVYVDTSKQALAKRMPSNHLTATE